jgi:hypothetical protein
MGCANEIFFMAYFCENCAEVGLDLWNAEQKPTKVEKFEEAIAI